MNNLVQTGELSSRLTVHSACHCFACVCSEESALLRVYGVFRIQKSALGTVICFNYGQWGSRAVFASYRQGDFAWAHENIRCEEMVVDTGRERGLSDGSCNSNQRRYAYGWNSSWEGKPNRNPLAIRVYIWPNESDRFYNYYSLGLSATALAQRSVTVKRSSRVLAVSAMKRAKRSAFDFNNSRCFFFRKWR